MKPLTLLDLVAIKALAKQVLVDCSNAGPGILPDDLMIKRRWAEPVLSLLETIEAKDAEIELLLARNRRVRKRKRSF